MAVLADMIARIRVRVHDKDLEPPLPHYENPVYEQAIDRGLRFVNIALGETYSISTLPGEPEYLVELRGTVEMCYVRAAEAASGDVADTPSGTASSLAVPNLSISASTVTHKGPEFWLDLCDKLMKDYEAVIDAYTAIGKTEANKIQQTNLWRISRRTGRRTPYRQDVALEAVEAALSLAGSTVTLTWSPNYSDAFGSYEVQRSDDLGFAASENVARISDNHTVTYSDEPGTGSWYYRIALVNSNSLVSYSTVLTVVVP